MTSTSPDTTSEVYLTHDGRNALADRADHLRGEHLPRLIAAREGDPRDEVVLAEFERADSELTWINTVLATALPAESLPDDPHVVELGESVTIHTEDDPAECYIIVHPCEALVGDGERVSSLSPLGQALLGRRIGDEVDIAAPGGAYRCVIASATRPEHESSTSKPSA